VYFLVFEIVVPFVSVAFVRGTKAQVTNAWIAEWAVLAYWWK
jgi:hypothetical protein